jgi:hypothetical protein
MTYLVDTDVLIDYLRNVQEQLTISTQSTSGRTRSSPRGNSSLAPRTKRT